MKALAALILTTGLAQAQDSIRTTGPLSEAAFYNLVACAAAPNQSCRDPLVRWGPDRAQDLTVSLFQIEPGYPANRQQALQKALYAAIAEINQSGAALRLRFAPEGQLADVTIHLLNINMGDPIARTGLDPLDGSIIEAALVQVWWDGNLFLTRAAIVFPQDIDAIGLQSIALEELTQAMGLLTDIDNRWYEQRSIFSETSNSVTRLGPQDQMVLRRHYPIGK